MSIPTSFTYSIPYMVYFAFLLLLMFYEFELINRKQNISVVRVLCILGFLFFFGLRGFVYTDWANYYSYFKDLPTEWNQYKLAHFYSQWNMEVGFNIFSMLVKRICPDFFFWQFISSLIDVLLLNAIFKRYPKYYTLGFIFFFLFNGIIIEINLMRNVKSILLFFYSIRYIEEKKILPYILFNLLGLTFHFSSLIYIPLYFVLNKKIPLIAIWITFIVGNIIYLLQIEYIAPTIMAIAELIGGKVWEITETYFTNNFYMNGYGITIGYIERVFSFILFFVLYNKIIENNPKYGRIFLNLYFIYFACFSFLAEAAILTDRIPMLFICAYWILYPEVYSLLKVKLGKPIFLIILILYGTMKLSRNNTIFHKYENVLFGVESYERKVKNLSKYEDLL